MLRISSQITHILLSNNNSGQPVNINMPTASITTSWPTSGMQHSVAGKISVGLAESNDK